jgi:RimJ/RimL family protein N-acetyltransferase
MSLHVRQRFAEAPVLETARLTLRSHRPDDLPAYVAMWADPDVVRYTIGSPSPPQRTWMRLLGHRGHWSALGFGYWSVEETESARYIGELGYAHLKRELDASLDGVPEIGWALVPQAHGRGYATEALRAVVAWGDCLFDSDRTACTLDPGNDASARVASKLGFREYARVENSEGQTKVLLERFR